jgi:hypothetical protein
MLHFILAVLAAVSAPSQSDLTGEWAIELTTPRGHAEYTMYVTQEGPRLNGHLTSEYGEIQVKGSINGDQVKLSWSIVENGKTLDITVSATAKGDSLTGTARLGTIGEGPFSGQRTAS